MVGQGIFKVHGQTEKRSSRFKAIFQSKQQPSNSLEDTVSLVSRSVLYRVNPDFRTPGTHSGTAVCVHDDPDSDNIGVAKVAGFSSFAQHVSDVQRFDLEGRKFDKRLEEGRIAFYGALRVPEELMAHEIV